MKIICTQENLKNGLLAVSKVSGNSSTLPILNNVLLEIENGLLKISATNLEIGISTFVRCKVEEQGSVSVNAKTLLDLILNLPNDNITLKKTDSSLNISSEKYQTKINHLPTEDFPLIPQVSDGLEIQINPELFKNAIGSVIFAVSSSETQPEMSGVYLKIHNNNLTLTGTDRYRLAEQVVDINVSLEDKLEVIVPQKTMNEIMRLLSLNSEDITLKISNNQIAFHTHDTYLVSRLIEGEYPDYRQIIPENKDTSIQVQKKEFLNAVKTSGIFSKLGGSIELIYDSSAEKLTISSVQSSVGESKISLDCKVIGNSGNLMINHRYVLEMLNNIPDESLVVNIINENHPIVFLPENRSDYLYLVMPLKI